MQKGRAGFISVMILILIHGCGNSPDTQKDVISDEGLAAEQIPVTQEQSTDTVQVTETAGRQTPVHAAVDDGF